MGNTFLVDQKGGKFSRGDIMRSLPTLGCKMGKMSKNSDLCCQRVSQPWTISLLITTREQKQKVLFQQRLTGLWYRKMFENAVNKCYNWLKANDLIPPNLLKQLYYQMENCVRKSNTLYVADKKDLFEQFFEWYGMLALAGNKRIVFLGQLKALFLSFLGHYTIFSWIFGLK